MRVGSDKWTGAHGTTWDSNKPIKRSRYLRWALLVTLLIFVTMFVTLLWGGFSFLLVSGVGSPIAGFIAAMWMSGWGSPFRRKPIWTRNGKSWIGVKAPDEFETAIYTRAVLVANRITTVMMFAVFVWLGFATKANYSLPTDGQNWIMIGLFFAGICLLLPTVIAEFRTSFPTGDE